MLLSLLELLWWLQPEASGAAGGGGAPGGGGPPPGGCAGGGTQIGMLVIMMLVFYFVLIRPQQKRQREHDDMLKALKKGTVVRTTGGIRGEITDLNDREVTLLVADRTRINVLRSHIAGPEAAPVKDDGKDEKKDKS